MKNLKVVGVGFILVCLFVLFACGGREKTSLPVDVSAKSTESIASAQEAPAAITTTSFEYQWLKGTVERLNQTVMELETEIGADPDFLLRRMDRDLDAVVNGKNPYGSFSDYFVPNAKYALEAGAAKKDVVARLNRAVSLAEKEVYLSGFMVQLVDEGGIEAIRSYIERSLRPHEITLFRK